MYGSLNVRARIIREWIGAIVMTEWQRRLTAEGDIHWDRRGRISIRKNIGCKVDRCAGAKFGIRV